MRKNLLDKISISKYANLDDQKSILISVRVYDRKTRLWYWLDYALEGNDITGDWNQYIFYLDNDEDRIRRDRQDDCDVYAWMEDSGRLLLLDLGLIEYTDDGEQWNIEKVNEAYVRKYGEE